MEFSMIIKSGKSATYYIQSLELGGRKFTCIPGNINFNCSSNRQEKCNEERGNFTVSTLTEQRTIASSSRTLTLCFTTCWDGAVPTDQWRHTTAHGTYGYPMHHVAVKLHWRSGQSSGCLPPMQASKKKYSMEAQRSLHFLGSITIRTACFVLKWDKIWWRIGSGSWLILSWSGPYPFLPNAWIKHQYYLKFTVNKWWVCIEMGQLLVP